MVVKLYTMDLSPPVRAAMMAFDVFNVPFEKIEVNLLQKENRKPEHLKKNPLHSVPVFEDGDFILHDSHAIITYLADTYGKDDSWYPKDIKKRAFVDQKLFFDTAILFPRLRSITYGLLVEGNKNISQEQLDNIEEAYGFMEEFLSRTTYIAGDHVTVADLSAISNITSLVYLVPLCEKKYPKTTAWLTELKKEPYCQKHNEPGVTILGQLIKKNLE